MVVGDVLQGVGNAFDQVFLANGGHGADGWNAGLSVRGAQCAVRDTISIRHEPWLCDLLLLESIYVWHRVGVGGRILHYEESDFMALGVACGTSRYNPPEGFPALSRATE